MDTMILDKPMTLRQAAEYTGYSPAYIYKLVHLNKLPVYKPEKGRLIFNPKDLNAFVYRNRQSADYELREQAQAILLRGKK